MKTIFLTTVMVIAVQVMVNGQTNGKQNASSLALLPTVKRNAEQVKTAPKISDQSGDKEVPVSEMEVTINTINRKIDELNKQLEELKNIKTLVNTEITTFFDGEQKLPPLTDSSEKQSPVNAYSKTELRNALLKESSLLSKQAATLIIKSSQVSPSEKKQLMKEVCLKEQLSVNKQIEASELYGVIAREQFNENKTRLLLLMDSYTGKALVIAEAKIYARESDRAMRIATELREESLALDTNGARLGAMNNAEEKEFQALELQNQAIGLFQEYTCSKK